MRVVTHAFVKIELKIMNNPKRVQGLNALKERTRPKRRLSTPEVNTQSAVRIIRGSRAT